MLSWFTTRKGQTRRYVILNADFRTNSRTRPAEYRDTMSLVVRRVEAGTGVLSQWLTYKDESCARFKYTWARYQLQRRGSLGYEN